VCYLFRPFDIGVGKDCGLGPFVRVMGLEGLGRKCIESWLRDVEGMASFFFFVFLFVKSWFLE
jgi:hypothetical protein